MSNDESALGATGILLVATRGSSGPGEVLIKIRGGSETYLAWSDEPLGRGQRVLVVEALGARRVAVVPWSDPGVEPDLSDFA